jgi:hypothetical protein
VLRQDGDQEARQGQGAPGRDGLGLFDVTESRVAALERAHDARPSRAEIEVGTLEAGKLAPAEAEVAARIDEGMETGVDALGEASHFQR